MKRNIIILKVTASWVSAGVSRVTRVSTGFEHAPATQPAIRSDPGIPKLIADLSQTESTVAGIQSGLVQSDTPTPNIGEFKTRSPATFQMISL